VIRKLFVFVFLCASPLLAHDFWIEPSTFHPTDGERVSIRLRVGEHWKGESFRRDPSHLARFTVHTGNESSPVAGVSGREPAGVVRLDAAAAVVAYESHPRSATLSPARFARYIAEEGLERVVSPRTAPVRDVYSRSAKSILGDPFSLTMPVGLPVEIIPVGWKSPAATFRVLAHGKPLSGVTVIAIGAGQPGEVRSITDGEGFVTLPLRGKGAWLVKAVHIEAVSEDEYRSIWGSLTFALR
jgi:uncharacterized GH25 family protein